MNKYPTICFTTMSKNEEEYIKNLYTDSNKCPTICFTTMCKNEEGCIKNLLESVYKYIDTWVVCDTGSTDRTCDIVTEFFKEKGIPGELFIHEWIGFDVNKTKMFEACYNKADYILHLDADDLLMGNFEFTEKDAGCISYFVTNKRGSSTYKCQGIYSGRHHWKLYSVAHTIIKCLDNIQKLPCGDLTNKDFYVISGDTGARSQDPDKYLKDALNLRKQFFDTLVKDPDGINRRSIFYTAQSYFDQGFTEYASQWYSLYTQMNNTWIEEVFESYLRIGQCLIKLNYPSDDIIKMFEKAIDIEPDRAEPYYMLGKYYNDIKMFEKAYNKLKLAKTISLKNVMSKYILFINKYCYGNYVNDQLSVACFWSNRPEEGIKYIEEAYNDEELINLRPHLDRNRNHFRDKFSM
jgi:glycosyltransferase involved in cell wall biosynthesis